MSVIPSIKAKIKQLMSARATPSEIALGVAIGIFIGVLPLYGLHLVLWLICSFLVRRANKWAMFAGTNISLPWTIPLITWVSYEMGRRILASREYQPLSSDYFRNFDFHRISSFYYPLFVGSVILGVIGAVVGYAVTYAVVDARQKRKRK